MPFSTNIRWYKLDPQKVVTTVSAILNLYWDLVSFNQYLSIKQQALETEREAIAAQIDDDLLDQFERLFNSKGDAAVVAVEHGVCTGCHMKVTTATAARVKAGKEIVSCENCARILYLV